MCMKRLLTGALMSGVAGVAMAADIPADCSAIAAPDQPLEAVIHSKPVALPHISLRLNSQGMSIGGQNFVGNRLRMTDSDSLSSRQYEFDLVIAHAEGETLAGRTFLIYPVKSSSDQPQLGDSGFPVIQGWSVEGPEIGSNIKNAFNIASMTLTFGDISGGTVSGEIYFCLAADSEDRFTKTKVNTTYLAGRFEAVVE